jgi:hypothetical protein
MTSYDDRSVEGSGGIFMIRRIEPKLLFAASLVVLGASPATVQMALANKPCPPTLGVSHNPSAHNAISSVFGTFGGFRFLKATNHIPYHVNQGYGWRLKLNTQARSVHWREEFSLPAVPHTWGFEVPGEKRTLQDGGLKCITEGDVAPSNGWVENSWCVAQGDPKGEYAMKIYVDGTFVKRFNFTVE